MSETRHYGLGSDEGGENWAAVASLVETCKLNAVDPQRYLAELLTRLINRWPQSRIDETTALVPAQGRQHLIVKPKLQRPQRIAYR